MSKSRDEISMELWCRVYASVRNRGYMNRDDATNAANTAVKDFNKEYPSDSSDYGYIGSG